MKYPPCKICKHSKAKHGQGLVSKYVGYRKRRQVVAIDRCFDCDKFLVYGFQYEWEIDVVAEKVRPHHIYEADNLRFLEHKSRRYDATHKELA